MDDVKAINLDPEMQAEYLMAFSVNTNLKLVKKYVLVRLASYLISIQQVGTKSFVDLVCSEARLLEELLEDVVHSSADTTTRVSVLVTELKDLILVDDKDFLDALDDLIKSYAFFLSDDKREYSHKYGEGSQLSLSEIL